VRVWDLSSLCCVAVGSGHTDAVGSVGLAQRAATYASKRAFAVSGGMDKVLKRWTFVPTANGGTTGDNNSQKNF